jgi:hypothetical protein
VGVLQWLRDKGAPWIGNKLSRDRRPAWMLGREKVKASLHGVAGQFWFLPYLDSYTQETELIRKSYRWMLRDSTVKSALFSKLWNVASLDLDVQPDGDGPRAKKVAGWVRWALLHSCGGLRGLVENTVFPACLEGFSIAEKVWGYTEHGEYRSNVGLAALKAKDPDIYRLMEDQYRNLGGITAILLANEFFPISNFVYIQHMPLYGASVGTSDLRAAYRAYWMIDTAEKLRMIGLEKWGSPFLVGKYGDAATDKPPLDAALSQVKQGTWISIPESAQIEAMSIANLGTSDYSATIKDLMHEVTLGISFATLQSLEGNVTGARAATQVHRDQSELPVWYTCSLLEGAINEQLVPDLVDLNMVGAGYPLVTIGGINDTELKASLEIDAGLLQMGLPLSRKATYGRYRRQRPEDQTDTLKPEPAATSAGGGGSPLDGLFSTNGHSNGNGMIPPAGSQADDDHETRPNLGETDEESQFDDADDYAEPPDPKAGAGVTPATRGDVALAGHDGAAAAKLLANSVRLGTRALGEIARDAVKRLLKSPHPLKVKTLFTADERLGLADALAACNSTADLLGRSRIQERADKVRSGVKMFAEDPTPFSAFDDTTPIQPLSPRKALDYFRRLFPRLGVQADRFGTLHERAAFTLAKGTDEELLTRVQNAISEALESGEVARGPRTIAKILDNAGVSEGNPQYSEMVFRTNMMDSYNSGTSRELATKGMRELFPVWKYLGISDGRERASHAVHFNKYYPSSVTFAEVRDSVKGKFDGYNDRCTSAPIADFEWAELQAKGEKVSTFGDEGGMTIFDAPPRRMPGGET